MGEVVIWSELTAAELRDKARADAIVLLPVASIEQHGPHLPVGVDSILCEGICRRAAEAMAAEIPVLVAPTLWCGMAEHHMAFGGTFSFDLSTYRSVLIALTSSIERHGFKRLIIVNGHGGNIAALAAMLPDLAHGPRFASAPPPTSSSRNGDAGDPGRSRRGKARLRSRDIHDDGDGT
jgi:creatinine amidohydrolase